MMRKQDHLLTLLVLSALFTLLLGACGGPVSTEDATEPEAAEQATPEEETADLDRTVEGELPVRRVPHPGEAAEAYFSPDGKYLIGNAKLADDDVHQTYIMSLDASEMRRINDRGADACSYFHPDGQSIIWTSTRDHLDLPPGNYSDANDYPQGAELYVSDLNGENIRRLTDNTLYEAEVSYSPDGEWILFGRQTEGRMDLWRMRPDGSGEEQITDTPDWQEGGAFYMPDSETILYRAWNIQDQGQRGMPMTIFTIKHDGTDLRQITDEEGTNWAPYPAPDGKHFAFVKFLPGGNFEIFMMNMETGEQRRLTYHEGFDGFPAISPDGKTLAFSSNRDAAPGERKLFLYLMDISPLNVGPGA
jgi:Tol biopolymer transport system component